MRKNPLSKGKLTLHKIFWYCKNKTLPLVNKKAFPMSTLFGKQPRPEETVVILFCVRQEEVGQGRYSLLVDAREEDTLSLPHFTTDPRFKHEYVQEQLSEFCQKNGFGYRCNWRGLDTPFHTVILGPQAKPVEHLYAHCLVPHQAPWPIPSGYEWVSSEDTRLSATLYVAGGNLLGLTPKENVLQETLQGILPPTVLLGQAQPALFEEIPG